RCRRRPSASRSAAGSWTSCSSSRRPVSSASPWSSGARSRRRVTDVSIGWDETLLRLAVAALLGAVIGLERELDEKAAGLRTHMLVSAGAALFTLVGAYGFAGFFGHGGNVVSFDPSRVAAQIVTGIGFLGAGVIFPGIHDPRPDDGRQPLARGRDRHVGRRRLLGGRGAGDGRRRRQPAPARVAEGTPAAAAGGDPPRRRARGRRDERPRARRGRAPGRPARAAPRRPPARDRGADRPRAS